MGYYDDYYRARVTAVQQLSPTMIRITFGDEQDLARFVGSGAADERLVVIFPAAGSRETPAPQRMPDGTLDYPSDHEPEMRSYTVRRWDPSAPEMIIDFVAHEGGVAATWARQARPGDVVYLSPASGWHRPPPDTQWQLLAADLTGLPALGRIVEELAPGTRAHCVIEVADAADRQELNSSAEVTYEWLVGGNGHAPSRLLERIRDWPLPEEPGYVWFAAEAAESRAVRRYVRRERGLSTDRFMVLGYWRQDKERWMARYEEVGAELETIYQQAIDAGQNENEALDIYDDALERAGL